MSDDSIHAALSSAYDKATSSTTPSATPAAAAPATQAAAPATTPPAQSTTSTPSDATAGTTEPQAAQGTPQAGAASATTPAEGAQEGGAPATPEAAAKPTTPAVPPLKAPQSWRPAAREKWAALPPEVQQDITRREREMAVSIQQTAQHRKVAESFQQVVQPYVGMIQAEGGDPFRAVGSLLQTAAALRTAPPGHKAQLVANLITTFGVPVDALDAALAGQPPAQGQPQAQQPVDPAVIAQQVQQRVLQGIQQQRQTVVTSRAKQETDAFLASPESEFMADANIRNTVADIMEINARRGVEVSLKDAYKKACEMDPEVSKVLAQREQAKQANAAQASTQRARDAASSVRTTPAASPAPKDESIRGYIESAWASSSGR